MSIKSCVIIGGGSSVKDGIAQGLWSKLENNSIEVWSINYAFMTMPFLPKRQFWLDTKFFKNNIDKLENLCYNGVQLLTKNKEIYKAYPEIKTYDMVRMLNTKPDYDAVKDSEAFSGELGLSGTFALSIAVKEKYDIIFLLGYDYGTPNITNTNTHYYQNELKVESHGFARPEVYLDGNKIRNNVNDYNHFLKYNSKIYNVSLISNINIFDKISYDTMFELIGDIDEKTRN